MTRRDQILEKAIEALEDGRDPLSGRFLYDNGVTLDELFELTDDLTYGAHLVLTNRLAVESERKG